MKYLPPLPPATPWQVYHYNESLTCLECGSPDYKENVSIKDGKVVEIELRCWKCGAPTLSLRKRQ